MVGIKVSQLCVRSEGRDGGVVEDFDEVPGEQLARRRPGGRGRDDRSGLSERELDEYHVVVGTVPAAAHSVGASDVAAASSRWEGGPPVGRAVRLADAHQLLHFAN